MENCIELSEVVDQLRKELLTAQSKIRGSDLKFEVIDIEVELQVVTTKSGGGGVKFVVEAAGSISKAQTQKLKFKLKPVGPDGKKEVLVSDQDQRD
ncbi:MAG: hypothetical protein KDI50_07295 [Candidatus Competibacteraceae bacterium]|nr:hypothetical protein [Candidatus Competibacteraceae bacterium]